MIERLYALLFFIGCIVFINSASYAEIDVCKIGDLTKGHWSLLQFRPDPEFCPITGSPAASSPWPSYELQSVRAYAIAGNYKIVMGVSGVGYKAIPPECFSLVHHNCVRGFAEAYAKEYVRFKDSFDSIYTWKLSGNLITKTFIDPHTGNSVVEYLRVCTYIYGYYEWRCGPGPEKGKNYGGTCSIDQAH